jgi:hypothetical protein
VRGLSETAVKGLAQFEDDEVGGNLVKSFNRLPLAEERAAVIDVLVTRKKWAGYLLAELKTWKNSKGISDSISCSSNSSNEE